MSIVEFVDYTNDNIKIIDNEDIKHPYESSFVENEEGEEYEIKKIYYGSSELLISNININIGDNIYDPAYDTYTVYEASINNDNKYVLKKGVFESEEELVNEIKLQNRAAEFGLSDPIIVAYILENEYGLVMKKYENSLFGIFDSEYYNLEDKIKYVDRIKIMLEDLVEKVKICHGDFNLDNIMVDEEDNLKLVDFGKGCFLDDDSKKNIDTDNFNNCNFYLDTISEQVTFDLQNYWYEIMK
jgi:serine/threonine protein kinase